MTPTYSRVYTYIHIYFFFNIPANQMIEDRMLASPVLMRDSSFTTMFTNTTATCTHDALRI